MKYHQPINRLSFLLAGLFAVAVLVGGVPVSGAEETLNNASIIELQGLNLGDAVILEKIKTSKCNFDTSVAGLKQLKGAKVSDAVIQGMLATKSASPAAAPAPAAATSSKATAASGDSNDPAVPHTAGVWLLQGGKLVRLESEASTGTSGGGFIGPWGIGKRTQTARFPKSQSPLQLTVRRPVFYFYIGRMVQVGEQVGSGEFMTAQGPNEIVLTQLTVRKDDKNDERLLEISSHGAYGNSSGIDSKAIRDFDAEKIAEGIYKVVPKADLADGEYAFSAVQTRGHGRFYSFGVAAK